MIDFNKPVQTRDGKPVRVLCTDAKGDYPIVGLIHRSGEDIAGTWTVKGRYMEDWTDDYDLVQTPVKRSVWLNIFPDRVIPYKDKVNADLFAMQGRMQDRTACIEVHYTEGEGLEDV